MHFYCFFYHAVRVGSTNTVFPVFRSTKQVLVTNFCYTTWACILSDRNVFCTLRGGRTGVGYNAPGAFLVLLFSGLTILR